MNVLTIDHQQICTEEQTIEVGKQYQYKEDSLIADVEVLSVEETDIWFDMELKIIKSNIDVGDAKVFTAGASKGKFAYSGMWKLYDLGTYCEIGD